MKTCWQNILVPCHSQIQLQSFLFMSQMAVWIRRRPEPGGCEQWGLLQDLPCFGHDECPGPVQMSTGLNIWTRVRSWDMSSLVCHSWPPEEKLSRWAKSAQLESVDRPKSRQISPGDLTGGPQICWLPQCK